MKFLTILLSLFIFSTHTSAYEKIDDKKKELIDNLIEIIDKGNTVEHFTEKYTTKYFNNIKAARPDVDDKVKDLIQGEIKQHFSSINKGEKSLSTDLYGTINQYFTKKELKAIIKFYRSDIGEKYLKTVPLLLRDTEMIANRWGESQEAEIRRKLEKRLKEENIVNN